MCIRDSFSSAGLDSSSSWRFSGHLANMPLYYESVSYTHLDVYKRQLWSMPQISSPVSLASLTP